MEIALCFLTLCTLRDYCRHPGQELQNLRKLDALLRVPRLEALGALHLS